MKKEKSYKKQFYVAVVIIIILALLIALSMFRAYRNYALFEQHKHYFYGEEVKIEPWMNIHLITANFNITKEQIVTQFNISSNKINSEASIYRLCKQYKKNCTLILEELNKIK